jgi:RNA polymerase sigma-70 factor (ECF subfamily)
MAVEAYQELGGALVGYLRANLRCDEDAQDMAQEVYMRITCHPEPGEIQSLKAFVFTIAKNLLRDRSRRNSTKLSACSISADDVTLVAVGSDPTEQIEADERARRIETVVAGLRPACRDAYRLRSTRDLSYVNIADCMQISVSMVEKHISAASRALRADCLLH